VMFTPKVGALLPGEGSKTFANHPFLKKVAKGIVVSLNGLTIPTYFGIEDYEAVRGQDMVLDFARGHTVPAKKPLPHVRKEAAVFTIAPPAIDRLKERLLEAGIGVYNNPVTAYERTKRMHG